MHRFWALTGVCIIKISTVLGTGWRAEADNETAELYEVMRVHAVQTDLGTIHGKDPGMLSIGPSAGALRTWT